MRIRLILAGLLLIAVACGSSESRVVVAAGTTLVDSGFIEAVAAVYEEENPGVEVSVVAQPTMLALELGREGAADLLLTHAPEQEAEFVDSGHSLGSEPLVESRFLVVGPVSGAPPAGLPVGDVFTMIAEGGLQFVSRGDGSGTNDAELEIWDQIEVDPADAEWYLETGQGMGPTLLVADQREAIALSELGAFVSARSQVDLIDYQVAPEGLSNVYTAHVAASGVNAEAARELFAWLTSEQGRAVMEEVNMSLFSEIIYAPVGD